MSKPIIELVSDPKAAKELGVSLMSLWRWDRDPSKAELGWPPQLKIGCSNYRERSALESFKEGLIRRALEGHPRSVLADQAAHARKCVAERKAAAQRAESVDATETAIRTA